MLFRVRMLVDPAYAHFRQTPTEDVARELGLRWVRGLVDLCRYSRGETYRERRDLVNRSVSLLKNVETDTFDGLLVEYVERRSGQAILRGLRAVSDFEFEFQLALMNRKLNERVETIFMMPKDTYTFLSSRIVKEIARLGGDVSAFVPSHVREALTKKLAKVR